MRSDARRGHRALPLYWPGVGYDPNFDQMPDPKRSLKPENDPADRSTFLRRYTWIIIKNVVGWVLMLSAIAVGSVFPVPLGTPMFIIGFAMITLPGKRRLTSGALRGIPIKLYTRKALTWRLAIALLLPPAAVWFLAFQRHPIVHPSRLGLWRLCASMPSPWSQRGSSSCCCSWPLM